MNVQELIDRLNEIEDKSVDVKVMLMDGNEIDIERVRICTEEINNRDVTYCRIS